MFRRSIPLRCIAPPAVLLPLSHNLLFVLPSLALSATQCSRSRHSYTRLLSIQRRASQFRGGGENVRKISQLRIPDIKLEFFHFCGTCPRPVGEFRFD